MSERGVADEVKSSPEVRRMICITCPLGCHLEVSFHNDNFLVSGNRCQRGETYAREEVLNPRRTVTATCAAVLPDGRHPGPADCIPRRVPVRTSQPFPKESIQELLDLLRTMEIQLPVKCGDIVMQNALGTGIDVICTRSLDTGGR
ncbi:MAG: DUF1667 domain-containing protein [Spirochaetales bacterium]|nr:DUF1667 domain-containing protein [Spirochaetales bacterium]